MDGAVLYFGTRHLKRHHINGKRILEVGSLNVNGTLRDFIESHEPSEYIGIDIVKGPGVDLVMDGAGLVWTFGPRSFDSIVCTCVLEHVWHWKVVVAQMKKVLKEGGWILVAMPTPGFPYHGYPSDHWRATSGHLESIFESYEIIESCRAGGNSCLMAIKGQDNDSTSHVWVDLPRVGLKEYASFVVEKARSLTIKLGGFACRCSSG